MAQKFDLEERVHYLKQYGSHCMAYSTLQPGMQYFDMPGVGYLAFMICGGTRFVLGDPICAERDKEKLIENALKEYSKTSFYQISKATAELLHQRFGYYMNVFGTETNIYRDQVWNNRDNSEEDKKREDLERELKVKTEKKDRLYSTMGSDPQLKKEFWKIKREVQSLKKRLQSTPPQSQKYFLKDYLNSSNRSHLRRHYNAARSEGIQICEIPPGDWNIENLREISEEWINQKQVSDTEMRFFTKPLDFDLDSSQEVKLFLAKDSKKQNLGFLLLDPLYSTGRVIGYYADILRVKPGSNKGTGYFLLLGAMEKTFEEGFEIYTLGLSPFHRVFEIKESEKGKRKDNRTMTLSFRTLFKYGNFLYNARDQAFHKERFAATMTPTFCATRKKIPLKEMVDGFKVSGINPLKQLVLRIIKRK